MLGLSWLMLPSKMGWELFSIRAQKVKRKVDVGEWMETNVLLQESRLTTKHLVRGYSYYFFKY